ncbi:MAG: imelysin family protein, partial [Pseudomonadota bacterium]
MIHRLRTITLALICALVAACGGGGGGSSSPPATTTPPPPPPPPPAGDPLGEVQDKDTEARRLFAALADEVIAPGHEAFAGSLQSLEADLTDVCGSAPTLALADVQQSWRDAMLAWQAIQIVRFGPVTLNNVNFRIQFFPDPNNAAENNSNQVLGNGAPISEAVIAGSAVGAQGLPALEYLLFTLGGLDDVTEGPRRCEFGLAVAANLRTMVADLLAAWTGDYRDDFAGATGAFADVDAVLTEILETMAVQGENIGDRKLGDGLNSGSITVLESFRA